jgi:hypothetical protein
VIVVNAKGVRLTGGKEGEKIYWRHSGYPGGIRGIGYTRLLADRPALAVEKAIKGMLPKNRLGRQMFGKLAVYEGPDHPHQAQKPAALGLGEIPRWEGLPVPQPRPAPKPKDTAVKAKRKPPVKRASSLDQAPREPASQPKATNRTSTKKQKES